MPKYVFEQAAILPAADSLTAQEARSLSVALHDALGRWLDLMHHERHEVIHEPPFEQVTADWMPPDENGLLHPTGSRPIDLS